MVLKIKRRKGTPNYQIEGTYKGMRIRQTTGTTVKEHAETKRLELEQNTVDGIDPGKIPSFDEVVAYHILYGDDDVGKYDQSYANKLKPFIGKHRMDRLQRIKGRINPVDQYINKRISQSNKKLCVSTVNKELSFINKLGNLCVTSYGLMKHWTPIKLIKRKEGVRLGLNMSSTTESLSWDEEVVLMKHLPRWLGKMIKFTLLTGCRDQEVCSLKWNYLVKADDMWFFKLPWYLTKSKIDRPVVLNSEAKAIVSSHVGNGSEYVFPSPNGSKLYQMNQVDYQKARAEAGKEIPSILNTNIHSLRDTFATRLKDAGVAKEERDVLMGHVGKNMSDLYGEPQMYRMLEHSQKAVVKRDGKFMLFSKVNS